MYSLGYDTRMCACAEATLPEHHTNVATSAVPVVRLQSRAPPPAHYYAGNLLALVDTVLERYGDILEEEELRFGLKLRAASEASQRLFARLVGRRTLIREDRLCYAEVGDVEAPLAELATLGLVERCPAVAAQALLELLTVAELRCLFWEVPGKGAKAERIAGIVARVPERVCRWRVRRHCRWLRLGDPNHLHLYQLLFFGDRQQDLTTFVLRDLGVFRFEAVALCRETRQFADREALESYLRLNALGEEIAELGRCPSLSACRGDAPRLLAELWAPYGSRLLERRRSRLLNALARKLERAGDFDHALACYGRSTHVPARERRVRILQRLGDKRGVEGLRAEILAAPQTALEQDFAARFKRPLRRPALPVVELPWLPIAANGSRTEPATERVERHALALIAAEGGTGWHLENDLPMAIFALAYWDWIFAPVPGAFVNAFQTGPLDLFWPDFFASRRGVCEDPLDAPLKPCLLARTRAKAGIANRLFNWRRFTPDVARAVIEAIPEAHLRALLDIVRADLSARRSGFPDLTVVHGPGGYEFVEVKGPGDQLQIHQRLWIEALLERGLPVRVLRLRKG